jgi:chemotaxis protein methyltransferase CheR
MAVDPPLGTKLPTPIAPAPDPALYRIRDLIYQNAGIFQADHKLRFLQDRCERRMQELNLDSPRDYLHVLVAPGSGEAELSKLLNEVTVGETCFFRNQAQLDGLSNVVLPQILQARSGSPTRHLRVWSAGCSTGEEPYTLAILLLELQVRLLKGWSFEVLATDLNQRSLEAAEQGVYGEYSLRNLNPLFRRKYFEAVGDKLRIGSTVRACVSFQRLNLLDSARVSALKNVDVIFCCNVLIYFDTATKRRVLDHFFNSLLPHGYVFLGQSESMFGITDDFRLVHLPASTAYLKAEHRKAGGV